MSVSIDPCSYLGFSRPLTRCVKRSLTITNPNAVPVAFKVKTTAPKLYRVRPNLGRIEPGNSVDVSITLQPMKEDPPLSAECKNKFMIQSTVITSDRELLSLHDIWTSQGDGEHEVHEQKLKVIYLPPDLSNPHFEINGHGAPVVIDPSSHLGFHRPLTRLVKCSMTISNPNDVPVAFKVKTNATKLYYVRPNSGRIEPGNSVDVCVTLLPMKEDPPLSAKCKDAFMIQSTIITSDRELLPLHDMWGTSARGEDATVSNQKLKVAYLPPEGQTLVALEKHESRLSFCRSQ